MVCKSRRNKRLYRYYPPVLSILLLFTGCKLLNTPVIDVYPKEEFTSASIITFINDSNQSIQVFGADFGFSEPRIEKREPSEIIVVLPNKSTTFHRFRNFNDELFSAEIVSEYIMLQGSGLDYTIAGWPESAYSWPQANLYGAGYLIGDDSSRDFEFDQGTSHYHVDMNLGDRESIIIRVYATIRIGADLSVTYTVDEVVGSSSVDEEGEPLPITLVE